MTQTRRDLLKAGGGVLLCTCTVAGVSSCAMFSGKSSMAVLPSNALRVSEGKVMVDVARVPSLAVVGGSAKWESPGGADKKICVVRSGEHQFDAFINRCTHGGKELEYRHDEKKLRCASFGHSEFDLQGRKVSGPAATDLTKLSVTQNGDLLEIAI